MSQGELSLKVGEVFYAANRTVCRPGVPWDMVSAAPVSSLSSRRGHVGGVQRELGR